MNPIVKAQLTKFSEMNPNEEISESDLFEVMSIFAVENGILGENIDPFRAHLKGNEFGIDGLAISIQGTLCTDPDEAEEIFTSIKNHTSEFHFYQSKTSEHLDYGDISKFLDAVYDFFTSQRLNSGEQLQYLSEVKDSIYKASTKTSPALRCYYCTTGTSSPSDVITTLVQNNLSKLNDLSIFSTITIEFIGAKEILHGFRSATNSTSAKLNFQKAVTLPSHPDVEEAYIGYVPASEILAIALTEPDQDGDRHINRAIFYDNVRDFNIESEINKSIISEIESGNHSSFVFKNNGITIVSKNIDRKGDTFTLDDYQIVNGCQTTNILYYAKNNAENIHVPLRLIGSSNPDFVSSIIIGTNKQNEVREDQFWALLPFMKDLEEFCSAQSSPSRIYIERRENQYRSLSVERTRIFRPSDLMKAAAAMFFFQPHRAARDHRGIRTEYSSRIFSESHNVELYHLAALALYKFDYLVRTGKVSRSRVIFRFYALYALVRKFWNTPDLLESSPKSQKNVKNSVTEVLNDNDKFAELIESSANQLEKIIAEYGISSREKVRDYIRTENVVIEFTNRLLNTNPTKSKKTLEAQL